MGTEGRRRVLEADGGQEMQKEGDSPCPIRWSENAGFGWYGQKLVREGKVRLTGTEVW